METLCSLDLETTGLDPERDAVIEIGVVRFRGKRVEAEYQTLVNPGRPLAPFITQLTGINDDMLTNAPRLKQVLPELREFVGDLPILGHNVQFDLSFLQNRGIFPYNQGLDTYELAAVVLPSAGRYGLSALASQLAVPLGQHHRALDDARTTHKILLRLMDRIAEIPYWLHAEIVRLGLNIEWGAGWLFEASLASRQEPSSSQADEADLFAGIPDPEADSEPPTPAPDGHELDDESLASLLEPGGPFSNHFPKYEHRSQQVQMLKAVARSLSGSQHLLVEAGTGTGKSMAYLIPSLRWAEAAGQRVVVSTNTINLQDQLLLKDVPDLSQILGQAFRASALKGRNNYLCPRQLLAMRYVGPRSADEMRVLAKTLVWLQQGGTGDRGELSLNRSGEHIAWGRLSADNEGCGGEACVVEMDGICPYHRARRQAEAAHVVVVNHALLLADIATGSRVIPEYEYLIVDEAHHLEGATTSGLSFRVTEPGVYRLLRDIGHGDGGLLAQLIEIARSDLPKDLRQGVESGAQRIHDQVDECRTGTEAFFRSISEFLSIRRDGKDIGPYGQQERIDQSTRTLPEWSEVEIRWDNLRAPFRDLLGSMNDLEDGLLSLPESGGPVAENLALSTRTVARSLNDVHENLDHMVFEPDPMTIYWCEVSSANFLPSLHAAPLEVGPLVERHLWHAKESVIMTSATLTTSGTFDYLRRRLNAQDADELALGSPFDYESSTLVYVANDIPEPSAGAPYQRAVEDGLLGIAKATGGRTLALFTSYSQLRRTAQAISGPLALEGIAVYEQGQGASRHALLETFRNSDQAVLLGTRSFWEGVDVPGPALSVLAIIRLPFDVPSDPIISARAEMYESPFNEYMLPEAILRFRQGFGRLIRSRSDRGVVITFDRRLLTKYYGQAFLQSLPNCTMRNGRLSDAPDVITRWLGI
jgi:DNA polymerase-3 subunit epsilon/ATP-dependent DNA helicase DinG